MLKAVVLGDLNLDIILKLPHEPLPDTSVPAEEAFIGLGGVGGNTVLWLNYLDRSLDIHLLTGVGDDVIGRELLSSLGKAEVRTQHVKVLGGERTGVMVVIEYRSVKKIVGFRGANSSVNFSYGEMAEVLRKANHAHVSGYFALNRDEGELLLNFLDIARTMNVPASIDLEGISSEKPAFIKEIRGLVRYALLNRSELNALSKELGLSAQGIREILGCEALIVKLGDEGALIYSNKGKDVVTSEKVINVVDPTGAGDAFNAAFIHSLIKGFPLLNAVEDACKVGAEAVKVLGGSPVDLISSQAHP